MPHVRLQVIHPRYDVVGTSVLGMSDYHCHKPNRTILGPYGHLVAPIMPAHLGGIRTGGCTLVQPSSQSCSYGVPAVSDGVSGGVYER